MVRNYAEFCAALSTAGFSMGGGNAKGIYAIVPFGWEEQDKINSPVRWHTGDPLTDPWEWRMRVLEERDDIAYAKLFFGASGYITRDFYPHFLAVRRGGVSFDTDYRRGTISGYAKRIYDVVAAHGDVALHEIKARAGFGREEKSHFDRALTELQARMYLTVCGRMRKIDRDGRGYGWNSTVFSTVETFWARRGVALPWHDPVGSRELIRRQILRLNPDAGEKAIGRFIEG